MGRDFGEEMSAIVRSDSSAALAISQRVGLGKVRHLQTQYLWIQERHTDGSLLLQKVKGEWNPADLLTKGVPQEVLNRHMRAADLDSRGGSTADSGRALSLISFNIDRQVNNISKIEGLVECITAVVIGDACEDGAISREIIWRILGIRCESESAKSSEQRWPVIGRVAKMPELLRKEDFPNCSNETGVACNPKFRGQNRRRKHEPN